MYQHGMSAELQRTQYTTIASTPRSSQDIAGLLHFKNGQIFPSHLVYAWAGNTPQFRYLLAVLTKDTYTDKTVNETDGRFNSR
jgi:hypothetical protein